ncbi:hypothetical protein HMPREF1549_00227 [Actinomyces johnsonii F0510]|uniref:Uncharacterized protein n=1 Tax=Actinomyces johnsonii F0510 TaxID=1227262 RepID=U1RU71_9ACTO|nr:hypothetical protein HMPREF1549_00227 [Actinomyces johnsonii F0510]
MWPTVTDDVIRAYPQEIHKRGLAASTAVGSRPSTSLRICG